ncbi:hypothetical protein YK48G_14700 [Lentilactobacillus fungorum]|uniref:DUF1097 domain-containing protein n=1 Tax=Lentilactobacillus fungorum TaxID=2201250 RepID=A0ABQ3VYR2_9LACO|nr:DUF1097 domain-containing protein [Lentilactobacillus fungorum]GHP14045.1 hypothetical protein YK48G_14700 [Lentilactobacillus fungorum]
MKTSLSISKEALYSALGIGIFTLFYGLLSGLLEFWMAPVAFITSAFYAGYGSKQNTSVNVSLSFGMGIIWGLIAYSLFQIQNMNMLLWTSLVFGVMAFIAIILQGTILSFTRIPAWLLSWGTFMEISLNKPITNWPLFVVELSACMLLGIYFLDFGSNLFKKFMYIWFPGKMSSEKSSIDDDKQNSQS